MKIDKRVWLILGVIIFVIFVVAAVFLYLRYSGQVSQQAELKSNLSTAQDTVGRLTAEESALAKQMVALRENENIKSLDVKNINFGTNGLEFELSMIIDPKIFIKTQ